MNKMRKIEGKIAVILVLVMAAGLCTGCFTAWSLNNGASVLLLPFCMLIDVLVWPFELIDLANGGDGLLKNGLKGKRSVSSPEDDAAFLTEFINLLPETERAAALERLHSIPEERLGSVVQAMYAAYALPYADRVSLAEAVRGLPDSERAILTETVNAMSADEMADLADEIVSMPETEKARLMKELREKPYEDWGLEYAAARYAGR